MGLSRSSWPASTRRRATTPEIGLLTEAMLNGVSTVTGRRASTSAYPKPCAAMMVVSRRTTIAIPGMPAAVRRESNVEARERMRGLAAGVAVGVGVGVDKVVQAPK